jgi:thioredoxin-like negative regulator of GroEL
MYEKTTDNETFMSFEEFSVLPGLQSIYPDYKIMDVSFTLPAAIDSEPYTFSFRVDTAAISSQDAAENYCASYLLKIMNRLEGESDGKMKERCITFITQVVEMHKIENQIRT